MGNELGDMKNELLKFDATIIDKAYFLGNKKYGYSFTNENNKIMEMSVFAGAKKNTVSFDEVKLISEGHTIEKEYDDVFMRSFSKMEIEIKGRKVKLYLSTNKKLIDNNYIHPQILIANNPLDDPTLFNKTIRIIKVILKIFTNII